MREDLTGFYRDEKGLVWCKEHGRRGERRELFMSSYYHCDLCEQGSKTISQMLDEMAVPKITVPRHFNQTVNKHRGKTFENFTLGCFEELMKVAKCCDYCKEDVRMLMEPVVLTYTGGAPRSPTPHHWTTSTLYAWAALHKAYSNK